MTHTEESWAMARARALKAADDVVRIAYGERGQRTHTLPAALGELRDALRHMDGIEDTLAENDGG